MVPSISAMESLPLSHLESLSHFESLGLSLLQLSGEICPAFKRFILIRLGYPDHFSILKSIN